MPFVQRARSGGPSSRHDALGAARATRPRRSTRPRSYAGVLEVGLERLVGAVREDDEVGRLVAHLLGEVVLVPAQRREDLRAVDAERVDHDAGLRAIERHAEDAHLPVADRAHLDLVGRVGDVEREEPRASAASARVATRLACAPSMNTSKLPPRGSCQ